MTNQLYNTVDERLFSIMLRNCVQPDGTIPHYVVRQVVRIPGVKSDHIKEIIRQHDIPYYLTNTADNQPGVIGVYYKATEVLEALEKIHQRQGKAMPADLTEVPVCKDTQPARYRRKRPWDQQAPDMTHIQTTGQFFKGDS